MNKFYNRFPFKSRFTILKKKIEIIDTDKKVLMADELKQVVKELFKTSIIGFVHLAVDLMIIFQSGLRFPSSFTDITSKILLLLKKREGKLNASSFRVVSTKTYQEQTVVFD